MHVMETPNGWRYGGDAFERMVDTLQEEIQAELNEHGFHVNIVASSLLKYRLLICVGVSLRYSAFC